MVETNPNVPTIILTYMWTKYCSFQKKLRDWIKNNTQMLLKERLFKPEVTEFENILMDGFLAGWQQHRFFNLCRCPYKNIQSN